MLHPRVEKAVLAIIHEQRIGFDECLVASCHHPSWAHFGFGARTCAVYGCPCCFLTLPPNVVKAPYDFDRKERLNAMLRAQPRQGFWGFR